MRSGGFSCQVRVALAIATAAAAAACSGSVRPHPASSPAAPSPALPPAYYLALGDSLSVGVQPDAAGVSAPTGSGYPDQLYAALRPRYPGLRLVKLGCAGETTSTMMHGGICRYRGGSQLAAAVAFLRAHRGQVRLVTIDIGANDPEQCGLQPSPNQPGMSQHGLSQQGLRQLASCAANGIPSAVTRLTSIMTSLTGAAGPGVRFVGMTYYLPALADWRSGPPGHVVAWVAEKLAASYNRLLDLAYTQAGAQVADVFGAFQTSDFTASAGLPRNVVLLCRWTWACAAPPRGPNQHANQSGYQVIARTFLRASGLG